MNRQMLTVLTGYASLFVTAFHVPLAMNHCPNLFTCRLGSLMSALPSAL
jgi:hypothetical protein